MIQIAKPCRLEVSCYDDGKCHFTKPCDCQYLTNADRIRGMSDEELSRWILENVNCDKENIMCVPTEYKNSGKCSGKCLDGRLAWLKQEVKE